jgi:methylglutaconyl-CoA hydratase
MPDALKMERRAHDTVWITINRPEARNALSREVNLRLHELMVDLDIDNSIRAIVFTGAGDKAFCAGADLKERRGVAASDTAPFIAAISGAINQVAKIRCPTIAAMNGSAYGGGMELALACDFRILVEGAELGLTEVRLGIMPGAGGTVRLPRLLGEARAKEMIMLGRRVSAARAYEIGLVNQVVPAAGLTSAVESMIQELAACGPLSVRAAKSSLERGMDTTMEAALEIERECYDVTLFSDDRNEGLAAFAEGRVPVYRGQ